VYVAAGGVRAVAMKQEDTAPVSIVALRADAYSADRTSVIISLTTKFSTAERKYSVPLVCLRDLIVDLQRLNAESEASTTEPVPGPTTTPAVAD
jgi:hypothetical protein